MLQFSTTIGDITPQYPTGNNLQIENLCNDHGRCQSADPGSATLSLSAGLRRVRGVRRQPFLQGFGAPSFAGSSPGSDLGFVGPYSTALLGSEHRDANSPRAARALPTESGTKLAIAFKSLPKFVSRVTSR